MMLRNCVVLFLSSLLFASTSLADGLSSVTAYDATVDQPVFALKNRQQYTTANFPASTGIIFKVKPGIIAKAKVKIRLAAARRRVPKRKLKSMLANPVFLSVSVSKVGTRTSQRRTEKKTPYSAFGKKRSDIKGKSISDGSYKIAVQFLDAFSNSRVGSASFSFSVVTASVATLAPTAKPLVTNTPVSPKVTPTKVPVPPSIPQPPGNSSGGLKAIAAARNINTDFWIAIQDPTTLSAKCQKVITDNFDGIIPEMATRWPTSDNAAAMQAQQENIFKFTNAHGMKVEGNHLMQATDKMYGHTPAELQKMLTDRSANFKAQGMDRMEINEFIAPNAGTDIKTMLKNSIWSAAFGSPGFLFAGIQALHDGAGSTMDVMINDFQGTGKMYNLIKVIGPQLKGLGSVVIGHQYYSMGSYREQEMLDNCRKINDLGFRFNVSELGLTNKLTQAEQASQYSGMVNAYLQCSNLGQRRSVGFWWFKDGSYDDRAGLFDKDCNEKPVMNSLRAVLNRS